MIMLFFSLLFKSSSSQNENRHGSAIVTSTEDHTNHKFASIEELCVYHSNIILGLQTLNVIEYSDHYHSWIAQPSSIFTTVHVKDLQSREILTLHSVRGFITLKCAVQ